MNLQQVRSKYPQYSDMSDQQLADSLHSKFYSDIPKSEFYSKIGLSKPGFLSQIGQGIRNVPGDIYGEENKLFGTPQAVRPGQVGLFGQKFAPAQEQIQNTIQARKGLSESLPLIASLGTGVGAEGMAAPMIEGLVSKLGGGALARILGSAASGAVGGAASSLPLGQNVGTGAAIGAPFGAAAQSVKEALPALVNYYKGQSTPEQIQQSMSQIPEGIHLPLGGVVQSPKLQSTESLLSSVPFSGGKKPYFQLNNWMNSSLDNLKSGVPATSLENDKNAYNDWEDNYLKSKSNTHNLFTDLADKANKVSSDNTIPGMTGATYQAVKSPYKFDDSTFKNSIDGLISDIKDRAGNDISSDTYSPIMKILNNYKNRNINDFKTARNVGFGLNDLYGKNLSPENALERRYIGTMKKGLEDSIDENASKYPELNDLRDQANQARVNQATFENLPNGKRTPFFKIFNTPNASDTSNFVNQHFKSPDSLNLLLKNVSPDTKESIATSKINPGDNQTIAKQVENIRKLNPEYRQALFGDKKPLADQMVEMSKMYPGGKSPGFEPQTGLTGSKMESTLGLAGGIGSLLGTGHIPAAAALASIPAGANLANRFLRSNTARDLYLQNLNKVPDVGKGDVSSILRSLMMSYQDKNEGNK